MPMHHGSCHCGAVTFSVDLELQNLTACNCSMCGRSGAIMAFVGAAQFTQTQGQAALTDYQFGKQHVHHVFCRTCGVRPFGWGKGPDGGDMYMINVRCLDGVDAHTLEVATKYDGKSL